MPTDNIWDAAIELQRKARQEESSRRNESTLLFVGSKQSGKTSLMYRLVDKAEAPKPSLALEYIFARKSRGTSTVKEVSHIWELAGGLASAHLLEVPVNKKSLPALSVVLAVDLSAPEVLCTSAESLLKVVRSRVAAVIEDAQRLDRSYGEAVQEAAAARIPDGHPDKGLLDVFPVPLVILGTKYDIFENFEPEKRKALCRFLRHLAHGQGASLLFTSLKNEALASRAKAALSQLAFGSGTGKGSTVDYNKPLNIMFGEDSFEAIDGSHPSNTKTSTMMSNSYNLVKQQFIDYFPQVEQKSVVPEDPARDPYFKEKDIDIMKAQKEKELEDYRKTREQEARAKNLLGWD